MPLVGLLKNFKNRGGKATSKSTSGGSNSGKRRYSESEGSDPHEKFTLFILFGILGLFVFCMCYFDNSDQRYRRTAEFRMQNNWLYGSQQHNESVLMIHLQKNHKYTKDNARRAKKKGIFTAEEWNLARIDEVVNQTIIELNLTDVLQIQLDPALRAHNYSLNKRNAQLLVNIVHEPTQNDTIKLQEVSQAYDKLWRKMLKHKSVLGLEMRHFDKELMGFKDTQRGKGRGAKFAQSPNKVPGYRKELGSKVRTLEKYTFEPKLLKDQQFKLKFAWLNKRIFREENYSDQARQICFDPFWYGNQCPSVAPTQPQDNEETLYEVESKNNAADNSNQIKSDL